MPINPVLPGNEACLPPTRGILMPMPSFCAAMILCAVSVPARADQVVMQNGDHYQGKVLSLTTNSLLLQSEILGNVTLPRAKVKLLTFGTNDPATSARLTTQTLSAAPTLANTDGSPDWAMAVRGLLADTNLVRQVQAEYLDTATPEANQKFNQTLHGLASGKLTVNDLRAEARSAADQLRAFKRELGEEAGDGLDHYLDILDRFLRETESSAAATEKRVSTPSRPTTAPGQSLDCQKHRERKVLPDEATLG